MCVIARVACTGSCISSPRVALPGLAISIVLKPIHKGEEGNVEFHVQPIECRIPYQTKNSVTATEGNSLSVYRIFRCLRRKRRQA